MRAPWDFEPRPKKRVEGIFYWHRCQDCLMRLIRWEPPWCFECFKKRAPKREEGE